MHTESYFRLQVAASQAINLLAGKPSESDLNKAYSLLEYALVPPSERKELNPEVEEEVAFLVSKAPQNVVKDDPDESACICKGNWRDIVKETESLLDTQFVDARGNRYNFFGIIHGSDDYYYGMTSVATGKVTLLSCVGSLEGHGFTPSASEVESKSACECYQCILDNKLGQHIGDVFLPLSVTKMILCPVCGNKRCPKATNHRHECTGSNEVNQPGSRYVSPSDH